MKKIILDEITALGGNPPYQLVAVENAFDWSSGSKGPRIGTNYIILRKNDLEKQKVFIRDTGPIVAPDTVSQRASSMQFVPVIFESLSASISADKTGNLRIYAEAAAVKIVQPTQK